MTSFFDGIIKFFHKWFENRRIEADKKRIERKRREALRREERSLRRA